MLSILGCDDYDISNILDWLGVCTLFFTYKAIPPTMVNKDATNCH